MLPAPANFLKTPAHLRRPLLVRLLWHGGLFAVLFAIGVSLLSSPQIAFLERQLSGVQMALYRLCYSARADAARKRIVLVPITEETFQKAPFKAHTAPPLPRSYHVKIIRELQKAGAAVIVFDLLFNKSSPDDRALALAVKQSQKKIVWTASWENSEGEAGHWLLPNSTLRGASNFIGHTRTPHNEIDPAADRLEALIDSPQGRFPALSVQAARQIGAQESPLRRSGTGLQAGPLHIPLGPDGTFKIVYTSEPDRAFLTVPYEEIYNGIDKNPLLRDWFKDKIVIIGDATEINKDFGYTPLGRMAGMEIHAQATATLLQQFFLSDAGPRADALALFCMMALAWLLAACLPLRRVLAGALLLLCAYFVFSTWLFVNRGLDFAFVVPSVAMLLMISGVVAERGGSEEGARRRMSGVLDQYVSPQLASSGAPKGEVTLVFTDIEGSSQLSERHGAAFEETRDEHFQLLRDAAKRWNGFEVETAGDSLFVVFTDAADAVRFAVDGQLALAHHKWPLMVRDMSGTYGAPSVPGAPGGALPVRIGMHTGTPFIGRDRSRLTYRGPATNRASRVMAAGHAGQILLSNTTWERAHATLKQDENFAKLHVIERGAYRLKGVGQDVLWEVCHPDLFEPPPRPLRDVAFENPPN